MSIRQLPEVDGDIEAAADWYDQQRLGLGDEFLEAVEVAQAVIARSPRAFGSARPLVEGREVRRFNLSRFPYAIIYEVTDGDAVILQIVHTRRRPGGWHSRLPTDSA